MLKFKLSKNNKLYVVIGVCVTLSLLFFVFIYLPTLKEMKILSYKNSEMKKNVEIANNILRMQSTDGESGRVISSENIAQALDEMTSIGQDFRITFVSIKPEEIEKINNSQYSVLPISFNIESTYRDLGEFLGALNHLDFSIAKVKKFDVSRDENVLSMIRANVLVEVLMSDG